MLKVGSVLGRYELIAHLKNGGMAALYLGRRIDPPDNRIFAIKVIHPHFLDDEDLVQMFLDEAGLSVRIQHPNVVHVAEVGEDRQMHFIAMEYIHGCSLAQLLQALIRLRRRMSPELAVHIAMNVLEGLHAAHELHSEHGEPMNVVHRDVSPQNVLLAHTGEIRLIDFGIAKSRMRVHHSQTGTSIRGKLRYMAPEHARGKSVDRRTDVYALGIVLWEMLTMRPLFWANTDFGVLAKVRDPQIEPPSTYAPRISPELDRAVLTALSADPSRRPESARTFRRMLSKSCPFAEALDEDQVAELLHVILGEELDRLVHELPHIASAEISQTAKETQPMRPEPADVVLDTLTDPSVDVSELVEESFAFVDLPPDEEISVDEPAASGAGLEDIRADDQDDPTELMSTKTILEVHRALNVIRERSIQEGREAVRARRAQEAESTDEVEDATDPDGVPRTVSDARTLPEEELPDRTVVDGANLSVLEGLADAEPPRVDAQVPVHRSEVYSAPLDVPKRLRSDSVLPVAVKVMRDLPSRVPTSPLGSTPLSEAADAPQPAPAPTHPSASEPVPAAETPPPAAPASSSKSTPLRAGAFAEPIFPTTDAAEAQRDARAAAQRTDGREDTEVDTQPNKTDDDYEYEPPTDVWQPSVVRQASGDPQENYVGLIAAVAVIGLLLAVVASLLFL